MSSRRGRGASSPWGRLKPVAQDPLESVGLPSKGDSRLLDHKTQEKYYTSIIERYMSFCADAGERDELLRRMSSMHIDASSNSNSSSSASKSAKAYGSSDDAPLSSRHPKDLSTIMSSLRKLREGLVASKRIDDFAVQAYLFSIRTSVLVKQAEAYHPAILYLLRYMHPRQPLTSLELQEVVGYLVLDTVCRRQQLAEAISIRRRYNLRDQKVISVINAMVHDNYVLFRKVQQSVDGHKARIMEWAESDMRMHTLKCFGRAYLSVGMEFLQTSTGSKWDDLCRNNGVGWELNEDRVMIRKMKGT